jgi:hypothetical protein
MIVYPLINVLDRLYISCCLLGTTSNFDEHHKEDKKADDDGVTNPQYDHHCEAETEPPDIASSGIVTPCFVVPASPQDQAEQEQESLCCSGAGGYHQHAKCGIPRSITIGPCNSRDSGSSLSVVSMISSPWSLEEEQVVVAKQEEQEEQETCCSTPNGSSNNSSSPSSSITEMSFSHSSFCDDADQTGFPTNTSTYYYLLHYKEKKVSSSPALIVKEPTTNTSSFQSRFDELYEIGKERRRDELKRFLQEKNTRKNSTRTLQKLSILEFIGYKRKMSNLQKRDREFALKRKRDIMIARTKSKNCSPYLIPTKRPTSALKQESGCLLSNKKEANQTDDAQDIKPFLLSSSSCCSTKCSSSSSSSCCRPSSTNDTSLSLISPDHPSRLNQLSYQQREGKEQNHSFSGLKGRQIVMESTPTPTGSVKQKPRSTRSVAVESRSQELSASGTNKLMPHTLTPNKKNEEDFVTASQRNSLTRLHRGPTNQPLSLSPSERENQALSPLSRRYLSLIEDPIKSRYRKSIAA